jgi:hypothetical protein
MFPGDVHIKISKGCFGPSLDVEGPGEDAAVFVDLFLDFLGAHAPGPCAQPVVVRLGPVFKRTTTHGGETHMNTIAANLLDDEGVPVTIDLPLKDNGGNPLYDTDGITPWEPNIELVSSNPAIAQVEQIPGNAGNIYGMQLGQAVVTLSVPFPDGSTQTVEILTSVLPSAAASITVKLGDVFKGEPPAVAQPA